jgi:hypothetical protein
MRTHVLQQTSQTPKEKFYSVPEGYFETSHAAILAQTSHKKIPFVYGISFPL